MHRPSRVRLGQLFRMIFKILANAGRVTLAPEIYDARHLLRNPLSDMLAWYLSSCCLGAHLARLVDPCLLQHFLGYVGHIAVCIQLDPIIVLPFLMQAVLHKVRVCVLVSLQNKKTMLKRLPPLLPCFLLFTFVWVQLGGIWESCSGKESAVPGGTTDRPTPQSTASTLDMSCRQVPTCCVQESEGEERVETGSGKCGVLTMRI